ncbi:glycosyltransferase family A protein [Shewanella ulleungensis]|uniref:glycosyltransferase family A protein n=1 Tax=Shewanella ulleungensis TaxID=2282699 RepID=UPI003D7A6636
MRILLLTTCIYNEENYLDFLRLTDSLSQQCSSIFFEHGVLFQNFNDDAKLDSYQSENYSSKFFYTDKIISLSKARNFLINQYVSELDSYDYTSFPDDDCWYPADFWRQFRLIAKKQKLDVFYTKFSSEPVKKFEGTEKHSTYKLILNSSSNTTIYSTEIVKSIKLFDESFGVGSLNNGGEDTDFSLRAMLSSNVIIFINSPLVGHREPLPEFRYRYFKGSYGVLKKHCFKSFSISLITCRKFLVGLIYIFTRKISILDFFVNKG